MKSEIFNIDVTKWIPLRIRIWLGPTVWISLAFLMLYLGNYGYQQEIRRSSEEIYTEGTVVDIIKTSGKKMLCPVVQYKDMNGSTHQFMSRSCATKIDYEKGDTIPVTYVRGPLQNYGDARVPGAEGLVLIPFLFSACWLYLGLRSAWIAAKKAKNLNSSFDTDEQARRST